MNHADWLFDTHRRVLIEKPSIVLDRQIHWAFHNTRVVDDSTMRVPRYSRSVDAVKLLEIGARDRSVTKYLRGWNLYTTVAVGKPSRFETLRINLQYEMEEAQIRAAMALLVKSNVVRHGG